MGCVPLKLRYRKEGCESHGITLMVVTQVENNSEGYGGGTLKESDFAITVSGNNPSSGQDILVMSAGPYSRSKNFPQKLLEAGYI